MDIKELKNEKLDLELAITIPQIEVNNEVEHELKKASSQVKMPGFRPGKVPLSMIKKKYGDSIRMDVVGKKIRYTATQVQAERNLRATGEPTIDDLVNEEGKDLTFTLKYSLLPVIKFPDWAKYKLTQPVLEVSDKDIDQQLEDLAKHSQTYDKATKAKAKKGDQVTMDAVGKVDGVAFEGGTLVDHKLVLGSGAFIPGFEDQLVGTKEGEEKDVNVTFPKEYHASNLAGKDAVFECKIKAVHKAEASKIDDEMAKKFGCKDLADLKEKISANIQTTVKEPIRVLMKRDFFDQLEKELDFEIPQSLLLKETEILRKQTEQSKEEISEIKDKSEEEINNYFTKLAARRVRLGLLLAEFVREKNLQVTEDDLRGAIISQARQYPGYEQQIIEMYQKDKNAIESLKGPLLEEKAIDELFKNHLKITEKKMNKSQLEKLIEEENEAFS